MRIRKRNNQSLLLTVQSVSIVMLAVLCFLVAGCVLIALIRFVIG